MPLYFQPDSYVSRTCLTIQTIQVCISCMVALYFLYFHNNARNIHHTYNAIDFFYCVSLHGKGEDENI